MTCVACALLLACGCRSARCDDDGIQAKAALSESTASQVREPLAIKWDAAQVDAEVDGRSVRLTRLTAAYDAEALGGELRVTMLDPPGINPEILVVKAWIDSDPAPATQVTELGAPSPAGYWDLLLAGKDFVQIVGPAGRPGLLTIRR